jgi:adenosylcobinamide-phosphate synthase
MVGYKNERYKHFGWAAARLDDIANYIPARITGLLIAVSSVFVCRSLFTVHCSLRTLLRDGRKHLSPNSGVPEAAMAGALGVVLGGPSYYGGVLMEKPYIGENKPGAKDQMDDSIYFNASGNALSIVKLTSLLGLGLALILLYMRAAI